MEGASLFRLLGDEARLRLLRVLSRDRFNVTELTGILGLAQSGVSRHLGLLKDAGLVREDREGVFTFYRVARPPDASNHEALWSMLDAEFLELSRSRLASADDARLQEILRLRQETFEQHAGPDTRDGRQLVPGRSWAAWARALGMLLPPLDVVDIGCGEGMLTLEVAAWAATVVGVDRSPQVLDRARAVARRRRVANVTWACGDLQRLPLETRSVDVALFSQALHHAPRPEKALAEAARVLRPGGRVLIQDLRAHGEGWVRDKLGDTWLGFSDAKIQAWLAAAGFEDVRTKTGTRRNGDPFSVLLACASRPDRLPER